MSPSLRARQKWQRGSLIAGAVTTLLALQAQGQESTADDSSGMSSAEAPSSDWISGSTPQAHAPQTKASAQNWVAPTVLVLGQHAQYGATDVSAATRTDTPIVNVPQSIQILTKTLIDEQDRRTLGEALANVSGVVPTRSEELLLIPPLVRGFPAEVYLDGLPIYAGNQQAFDPTGLVGVAQIDVLKGPSATLYGGGLGTPLGGIINIETERPDDRFGGYVGLRGGSYSTWNPYADVNLPLSQSIDARVAAEYQSNDSWIDKVHGRRWSVQPGLSFQLGARTDLLIQGQFNRRAQLEYSGLPAAQALAGEIDRDAFPGSPNNQPLSTNNNKLVQSTLHHAFNGDLKLTISGRYYDGSIREYGSFVDPDLLAPDEATPTVYPIIPITMITDTTEFTFDANLMAKVNMLGGSHTFLAGVDYDQTRFYSGMGLFVSNTPEGTIDLANPVYDVSYTMQLPVNAALMDHYRTMAVYAQDQANYGRLHVTGALRNTTLDFREESDYGLANDKRYNHVSPRIGASFDVAPGAALFAGYATAFRAAFGFVGVNSPSPEKSRNFEGGLKLALPVVGLSGTIAAFDQTHDNVATADPDNTGYYIQTGRQRARGVEADLIWEPTPAWSLLASYAHTNAKVVSDATIPVGDELARVPRDSGRVAARYRVLNGPAADLSFGAGVTALGPRQLTLPNTLKVPGYALIDAQAAYEIGRYTIQISAVNLADRDAFDTYQYFANPLVMPVQPRSAYLSLKASI